ncbi:hypothetical protein B0H16DRAFT_492556 [Mycena metata]|uniref:Uncharacterized protein n=1 Tax=Mycena metata TaxID=1033252 RepID=A0AAD7JHB4_9AGAR|nr:hypothetical protein B0H16DRAFT_492556 [Mycena metata]
MEQLQPEKPATLSAASFTLRIWKSRPVAETQRPDLLDTWGRNATVHARTKVGVSRIGAAFLLPSWALCLLLLTLGHIRRISLDILSVPSRLQTNRGFPFGGLHCAVLGSLLYNDMLHNVVLNDLVILTRPVVASRLRRHGCIGKVESPTNHTHLPGLGALSLPDPANACVPQGRKSRVKIQLLLLATLLKKGVDEPRMGLTDPCAAAGDEIYDEVLVIFPEPILELFGAVDGPDIYNKQGFLRWV